MTWTEFVALRNKLGWKKPYYVFPAADYEGFICIYIEALLSLRRDYFVTTGFNFATPEGRKALQLLVDLVQKDRTTPEVVTTFTEVPSYEYFIRNDGLFIRGWNTFDKDFSDAPYDTTKERHLRKAPIPYLAGGRPASLFGGWNLMISKFSKKKEAVIDFVKFLLSDESQEVFYTHGGYYPVVSSFYEDPESLRNIQRSPASKHSCRPESIARRRRIIPTIPRSCRTTSPSRSGTRSPSRKQQRKSPGRYNLQTMRSP